MTKKIYLGIDTSNYMTSICFIDENHNIIYDGRKLLEVKKGEKGLQQSEAVFQHVKNIPILFKEASKQIKEYSLAAIAVSKAPRPQKGSYMPVFLTGIAIAESLAAIQNIPLYYTTHQEGHISAGIHSTTNSPSSNDFLSVHLSGGTSEILHVSQLNTGYSIEQIGGTLDLHAGQLIDRIGVLLGLSFPAGKYLEQLAAGVDESFNRIPKSVQGLTFHFSGAEAEAKKRISNGESVSEIARAIEHVIASTIEKALRNAIENGYPKEVLIVGGVAQNQYIRSYLIKRLEHKAVGATLYFAAKAYSGDNAFGVATIGLQAAGHSNF